MAEHPLVSVCIPAYNGEDFIACTIESVLAQTLENFEVVVVDDASPDATVRIIQTFSDPRVKLIQNERNLGLAANWNKVLSCATGKYVKLMGGDDVLHPDCLRRQVEILEDFSNSDVVLAICNRNVIAADNDIVMRRRFPFGPGRMNGKSLIRASIRRGSNLIGEPVAGLFRREALSRTDACDPSNPYLVDLALWAELLKNGDAFVDPEYLVSFRISGKTASASIGRRQAAYFRSFVRGLRTEKSHDLGRMDAMLGCALSYLWCVARNCFMNFYFRKQRSGKTNQFSGLFNGVRPSSGAAELERAVGRLFPRRGNQSMIAAPEDGRTPLLPPSFAVLTKCAPKGKRLQENAHASSRATA